MLDDLSQVSVLVGFTLSVSPRNFERLQKFERFGGILQTEGIYQAEEDAECTSHIIKTSQ